MSVMRRMPDFGTFLRPDGAFVTELAFQGPFHNAPAFLYHRRQHPGPGGNRALDIRRLAVIQDPKRANPCSTRGSAPARYRARQQGTADVALH
jgi:hypothetical protein